MKHAKTKWSYGNRFELIGIRYSFFCIVKELTYIGPAVPLSGNTIKLNIVCNKHLFTYLQEILVPLTYFPICVEPNVSQFKCFSIKIEVCFFFPLYFPPIYTVLFKESWAEIFLPWIFSAVIKLSVEEIWTQFGRNKDRVFWYIGPQLSIAWKGRRSDFFLGSCKIVTDTDHDVCHLPIENRLWLKVAVLSSKLQLLL